MAGTSELAPQEREGWLSRLDPLTARTLFDRYLATLAAALYGGAGVAKDKPTIAYCRIGERSSHTWFVLKYLLGYPEVRNYDGSWTEWGSMVGQPIER